MVCREGEGIVTSVGIVHIPMSEQKTSFLYQRGT